MIILQQQENRREQNIVRGDVCFFEKIDIQNKVKNCKKASREGLFEWNAVHSDVCFVDEIDVRGEATKPQKGGSDREPS